jgi:hypothetical protein
MQQRSSECRERHDTQQQESRTRRKELVQRMGGIYIGIGHRRSRCDQNARDVRSGEAGNARESLRPSRPLAGNDESCRQ